MRHVHELQQSSATEASSLQLPPSCSGLLHHKQHFSTASDPLKPHNIGLVRYLCCLRIFGLLRKVGTPSLLRMRRNPHDIRRVVVQLQQPKPVLEWCQYAIPAASEARHCHKHHPEFFYQLECFAAVVQRNTTTSCSSSCLCLQAYHRVSL